MSKQVLVIDDEQEQAEGLAKLLSRQENLGSEFHFDPLYKEEDILEAIENRFFSLVILDLRMDGFSFDGMHLLEKIRQVNAMARVILVSAYMQNFLPQINEALQEGNILGIYEKESFDKFVPKIAGAITSFYQKQGQDLSENSRMLLRAYEQSKNADNAYQKGILFEDFLVNLFGQIGFGFIQKRVEDATSEVDLILRNDVRDTFLAKFGKYIYIEAKNKSHTPVNKNDFVAFRAKLDSSNQMAELGIIISAQNIARTVRLEALRTSHQCGKILLFANNELMRLISADNKLYEFKKLIDEQVREASV